MGVCALLSGLLLAPLIGQWCLLVHLLTSVLVTKWMLQLSFWRALFAVIIFWVIVFIMTVVETMIVHYKGPAT